jgi:septal ring factor EnvC (AmiA/AmiB activator)
MDATLELELDPVPSPSNQEYKSRPGALIWFFRKSRDNWKSKYMAAKATIKSHQNRVADVSKSRDQWRSKAEQAGEQRARLEAENAQLRAQIADKDQKKRTKPLVP